MKFPKNNTKHVLKELGSTLQLSNIQQRLQNLLKPMMFIYKVNCPSTKDFPLHYWIPTSPFHSLEVISLIQIRTLLQNFLLIVLPS